MSDTPQHVQSNGAQPGASAVKTGLVVAVTGLNATDNPGPGVSVIRALREAKVDGEPIFKRIVGLTYDTLDPGIYSDDIVDDVFLLPYPSQGVDALRNRLAYIRTRVPIDVIIPTLDSEMGAFVTLADELQKAGVFTFMPTQEQLDLRSKVELANLGEKAGLSVPKTRVISDVKSLYRIHEEVPYPFFVKVPFYGATLARSLDEAIASFHKVAAKWGVPIIVQQSVTGEEFNVVAVGDGEGGLVGAVSMRKTFLTDKGKGWAGVVIADPALEDAATRFMSASGWRGPCELEFIRTLQGDLHLLEINPRFPAWTYLSAAAGTNLPAAVVDLAVDNPVNLDPPRAGTMFVRIAIDQVANLSDFEKMSTAGEIIRPPSARS